MTPDKNMVEQELGRRGLLGNKASFLSLPDSSSDLSATRKSSVAGELSKRGIIGPQPTFTGKPEFITAPTGREQFFGDVLKRRLPFGLQADLARTDNPLEAVKLLHSRGFSDQDITVAPNGDVFVNFQGKTFPAKAGFGAELVGTGPGAMGALTGAAVGESIFPAGGGIPGAALGYVIGKGADEVTKAAQGFYGKKIKDELKTLVGGAAFNAVLQGIPGAAGSIVKGTGRFIGRVFGLTKTTEESRILTPRLLAAGARPPIASVNPNAKTLGFDQLIRNLISGDPMEQKNLAFVNQQRSKILSLANFSDQEIDSAISSIQTPTAAISRREVGEGVVSRVQAHVGALDTAIGVEETRAMTDIQNLESSIKNLESMNKNGLANEVGVAIRNRRREFGKIMSEFFNRVSDLSGGKKMIPTRPILMALKEADDLISPSQRPGILDRVNEMLHFKDAKGVVRPRQFLTIDEAHRIESALNEAAFPRFHATATPDYTAHVLSGVARSVDSAYDAAVGDSQAIAALRRAKLLYKIGIRKYADTSIKQILRMSEIGFPPDAETVASVVATPGETAKARFLLGIVQPETRKKIAAADIRNLLFRAGEISGGEARRATGLSLLKAIEERGPLLEIVHGKEGASLLRTYAQKLAAIQGKIDLEKIPQDDFAFGLKRYVLFQEARNKFIKEHPLRTLVKGTPEDIDRAFEIAVQPGNEATTNAVFTFLDSKSPEAEQLRRQALTELLAQATERSASGDNLIIGDALERQLSKYTLQQRKLLFPNGVDRELVDLAKETRFLFPFKTSPGEKNTGSSLKAASILSGIPLSIPADYKYLKARLYGFIADRPALLRAVTQSFKGPSQDRLAAQRALKILWFQVNNVAVLSGPPKLSPSDVQ